MNKKQIIVTGMTVLMAAAVGMARQEADPNKDYPVSPEVGPWMICAASYVGEQAPKMARDLVIELRRDYDLPAFVYNRGDIERQKMQEEMDNKRRQQEEALRQQGLQPGIPLPTKRPAHIEDQCAVMIGGYKDMDTAHDALEKIKKMRNPKSVPADRLILASTNGGNQFQGREANIFRGSFVTRNPMVPQEKVDRGLDPVTLKQLNADESYSLLKCRQPWTLAVKEFSGGVAIQPASAPTTWLEKLLGNKSEEHMSAIGKQAHEVARVLKQMGFDAYVLHTTTSSIVTVGAYADPDDDKLHQAQKQLRNMQFGQYGWVQLSSNPLPMPVPRP
jgi:hypothetical protein